MLSFQALYISEKLYNNIHKSLERLTMKYLMEEWIDIHKGKVIEYQERSEEKIPALYSEGSGWTIHDSFGKSSYGILQDAINLGNGHWLLGLNEILEYETIYASRRVKYFSMDNIRIVYSEENQKKLDQIQFFEDLDKSNNGSE